MKTRRYSEAQIFRILQEVDAGSQGVDVALNTSGASRVNLADFPVSNGNVTLSLCDGKGGCLEKRTCF